MWNDVDRLKLTKATRLLDQVVSFVQPSILLLRYYLFESFVVVSLFPIDSEYESVMPQTQLEKEVVDCNLLR